MSQMIFGLRWLAIAGAAAFLANCGGAGLSPSNPSSAASSTSVQARDGAVDNVSPDSRRCRRAGHRVAVNPCNVLLTASKTSVTITVYGPKGGTFAFRDRGCTEKNVASVSSAGGNSYTVTAGTSKGFCRVMFGEKTPHGRRVGAALLRVSNKG